MPGLFPAVGAVHDRRFVLLHIHPGQCRQEDDRSPAALLPDGLDDDQRSEPFGIGKKGYFFTR
ncbi:hypothetical protein D3C71_1939850 [compost metagenome]